MLGEEKIPSKAGRKDQELHHADLSLGREELTPTGSRFAVHPFVNVLEPVE